MPYFLQGLVMGVAYVAPIGLQNIFVINSALTLPRRRSLLTAYIVIFFDVSLAFACFFGIGTLMQHSKWLQLVILFIGSLIVLFIGLGLLRSQPDAVKRSEPVSSLRKTVSTACVVTWFNPQAIIDGTMMLGAFHVTLSSAQSTPFILGVAAASCLWFTGVTLLISLFQNHFRPNHLRMINIVCGAIMLLYGMKLFLSFLSLVAAAV